MSRPFSGAKRWGDLPESWFFAKGSPTILAGKIVGLLARIVVLSKREALFGGKVVGAWIGLTWLGLTRLGLTWYGNRIDGLAWIGMD